MFFADAEKAAPIEGKEEVKPEGTKSTSVPAPLSTEGKLKCPICGATFSSVKEYEGHARNQHKVGTSTSAVIY